MTPGLAVSGASRDYKNPSLLPIDPVLPAVVVTGMPLFCMPGRGPGPLTPDIESACVAGPVIPAACDLNTDPVVMVKTIDQGSANENGTRADHDPLDQVSIA